MVTEEVAVVTGEVAAATGVVLVEVEAVVFMAAGVDSAEVVFTEAGSEVATAAHGWGAAMVAPAWAEVTAARASGVPLAAAFAVE